MTRLVNWLSGRGRVEGHSSVILQFAREVVERRRSMQGALNEVRHPAVLDSLSDEDFRAAALCHRGLASGLVVCDRLFERPLGVPWCPREATAPGTHPNLDWRL